MTLSGSDKAVLETFAGLLEYPRGGEAELAAEGMSALAGVHPEAASLLGGVRVFLAETTRARAEEVFTSTFDLQATCAPYVGFHLFGEGYKRRVFLAGLNGMYSSRGFSAGRELPDHITVVLRFLAGPADDEEARILVEDGLTPALSKMIGTFGDSGNPYGDVLRALRRVLLPGHHGDAAKGERDQPATEVGKP
ncbi:MAG: nitrate reductase molybdenum cofactor assembly chaperone [Deltaproteobacteria bacterium CSP1-8]|nr:MAG: nitrate reductase molybdenum cofactor assembly chaperone [Deltaproteobacteria bacterium CSP1-8]